ncbi:MAG TPA: MarR family winged helix-turn-helix transcriptional regulator [Methylovirgula sp.]|nr:MarR family winged helix-turn-helix transcriptional regulator [Methylovirgula sp.]
MERRRSPAEEIASCTCLRLRKATRRVTQIYDEMLAPAGVTIAQFSLLAHLMEGRDLSVGELAEGLVTDPTTLTRNLKPLLDRALVEISADLEDRRRRLIRLTPAGRQSVVTAHPLWRKAQTRVATLLGESDTARLNKALDHSLKRLIDN